MSRRRTGAKRDQHSDRQVGMGESNDPDKRAWLESVLGRFEGPLTRYAARITGNAEAARDVTQETFMKLCDQDHARFDGDPAPWLFTVCRNRALDWRRREGRIAEAADLAGQEMASTNGSPPASAQEREDVDAILKLLATLPRNQQEVIRRRFHQGLSYKEIAAGTGLSVSNVGYLMHVGLKAIRERLGESNVHRD